MLALRISRRPHLSAVDDRPDTDKLCNIKVTYARRGAYGV